MVFFHDGSDYNQQYCMDVCTYVRNILVEAKGIQKPGKDGSFVIIWKKSQSNRFSIK